MKFLRICFIILFIVYLPVLAGITFIFPARERNAKTNEYHFIPLESTLAQMHDPAQYNTPDYWSMFTISLAGNFLLFIPLGFFLRYFTSLSNLSIFIIAVSASIGIELTQLIFHAGVCDIDDVILNSAGALVGIWLCIMYNKFFSNQFRYKK